jgi:hypothetical protein
MRHPLLALFLGLVLGVGLGAALFSNPRPGTADEPTTSLRAAGPSASSTASSGEVLARSDVSPSQLDATEVDSPESEPLVRRALARTTVPEPSAEILGEGTLSLEVRALDGRPLEGVQLTLLRVQGRPPGQDPNSQAPALADAAELQRDLDRAVERWTARRKGALFAISDAKGRAEIAGLRAQALYTLEAHLDDWLIRSESGREYFEAGMHVALLGEPLFRVPIELRQPDGSLADEGLIEQKFSSGAQRIWTWEPDGTELALRAGYHELRGLAGLAPGFTFESSYPARLASEPIELRVLEDGTTDLFGSAPVQLSLTATTSLAVRLGPVDPAMEGLHYRLDLRPLRPGRSLEELVFDADSPDSKLIRRRDAAWFPGLEPGPYGIALLNWRETEFAREIVQVEPGFNEHVLEVPSPDPRTLLIVIPEDPDGQRLRGVSLMQSKQTSNSTSSRGVSPQELPDGRLRVLMDPDFADREPGTEFFMECSHPRFGSLRQALPPGTTETTFRFRRPTRLTAEFSNYQGHLAWGRLRVDLAGPLNAEGEIENGFRHSEVEALVDGEGRAQFDKVAPGRYQLRLWVIDRDSRSSSTSAGKIEVVLEEGDNYEVIALPDFHDVRLHVPDVEPGTSLSLRPVERSPIGLGGAWERVQDDHTVEFHDLVAGPYTLSGRDLRFEDEILVPCPVLTLESRAQDALQVLISDEAGRLAGLGLRAGDWITGIEGRGPLTVGELRAALRGNGSISLIVQRGDTDLLLPVDLASTPLSGSLEDLGGQLEAGYRP